MTRPHGSIRRVLAYGLGDLGPMMSAPNLQLTLATLRAKLAQCEWNMLVELATANISCAYAAGISSGAHIVTLDRTLAFTYL